MLIEIRHSDGTLFDSINASDFQWSDELKDCLHHLFKTVEEQENTFVHFDDFVAQGFVNPALSGLPIKGNIDTILGNIIQDAVYFANLDDDDQAHYENARELDILRATVFDTIIEMQSCYLGKYNDLESYIRDDLDHRYRIPLFIMEAVDMDRVCSAYESNYNYTFVNGYLYFDVE